MSFVLSSKLVPTTSSFFYASGLGEDQEPLLDTAPACPCAATHPSAFTAQFCT